MILSEAILNFINLGNIEDYRNTLKTVGISKERLVSYERNIYIEPCNIEINIVVFKIILKYLKLFMFLMNLLWYMMDAYILFGKNSKIDNIIRNKDDYDILR